MKTIIQITTQEAIDAYKKLNKIDSKDVGIEIKDDFYPPMFIGSQSNRCPCQVNCNGSGGQGQAIA